MSVVLLGVLLLAAGVGLAFFGLRAFVILLPAFGLITGFFLGASIVASWLGEGLMSDIAEWITGYILGLLFALVSFTFLYAGAILTSAVLCEMYSLGVVVPELVYGRVRRDDVRHYVSRGDDVDGFNVHLWRRFGADHLGRGDSWLRWPGHPHLPCPAPEHLADRDDRHGRGDHGRDQ